MQVANVLAVVADAIEIEVVAGVETADAQAVETSVGAAADVGDTAERRAQIVGAVIHDVRGFDRVDGLWHVAHRCGGPGCRAGLGYARVVGFSFGADRCGR
ncbi:hypothetical protein D3C86_1273740 [compost metagenome]